jgi:hypothetical protein
MATRMQQRRGTAAQWISTNSGNGPILAAGEIGYESDTNKFKIGDGTNHWLSLDYFMDADSTTNPQFGSSIVFEGATANGFETTLSVTDPTADRAIILPDAAGTVVLANSSTGDVTISGDLTVSGTTTTINSTTINATTGIVFEGTTADAHETTISVIEPTADRAIQFPNAAGTVALVSDVTERLSKAGGQMTGNIDLNLVTKIINMPVPTADTDGASKVYVDTADALKAPINNPTFTGTVTLPEGTVTSPMIADGTIVNADISATAGISQSKISGLTDDLAAKLSITTASNTYQAIVGNVSNTEIGYLDGVTSAIQTQLDNKQAVVAGVNNTEIGYLDGVTSAIQTQIDAKAPLASPTFTGTVTLPSGTVTSAMILDGTIVVGDLADGAVTSAKILDGTIVDADINASAAIDWTKLGISSTVSSTEIGYVDGVTSAIQTQLDAKASLSGATFTGAVSGTDLTLSGNLTINGTTTNLNSTNLVIEDKNIVLGDTGTPTDTTADGGGITLKGATDKTFNWVDSTDSWTSSEHINLASGKDLKVNGTSVISTTAGGFIFTDGTQTKEGVPSRTSIIQKTAEYTLSAANERDSLIEVSHTGGTAVKVLIPTDATFNFPIGTSIDILRTNTGAVTIEAATPVTTTVNATPGLKLRAQWSSATLFKRAANLWVVMGDLSA